MRTPRTTLAPVLALALVASSAAAAGQEAVDPLAPGYFVVESVDFRPPSEQDGANVVVVEDGLNVISLDLESSDPRASGTLTTASLIGPGWWDLPPAGELDHGGSLILAPEAIWLVNDAGAWTGTGMDVVADFTRTVEAADGELLLDVQGSLYQHASAELVGSGAYEGLTMLLFSSNSVDDMGDPNARDQPRYWGVIVPSAEIPPPPDVPAG